VYIKIIFCLQYYEQYDTSNKNWQASNVKNNKFIHYDNAYPASSLVHCLINSENESLMLKKPLDLHLKYKNKPQNVEWQNIGHLILYQLQWLFSIKPYKWPIKITENWKTSTGNKHSLEGLRKTKENFSQKFSVPASNQTMHFLNTSQQYYSVSQRCGLKSFATTHIKIDLKKSSTNVTNNESSIHL